MNIPGYDEWKLAGPDEPHQIGHEDGDDCGRYPEPCDDRPPRGRSKPCGGVMNIDERDGMICCDTCGEIGN